MIINILTLFTMNQAAVVYAGSNAWSGDGFDGGSIFALAIDPATPTPLYTVTDSSGVFSIQQGGKIYLPLIVRN